MCKILSFLVLVICSLTASAQKLEPGFIVTTSKDTLRGFIRERFQWTNVDHIEFSPTAMGESKSIEMTDVDNFYINKYDNYFFRRPLDIDKKPVDISRLDATPGRMIVNETVVIRLLAKGAVNLYDYVDENAKKHFFVQKGADSKIEELAYVRYTIADKTRLVDMPYFVESLKALLSDCDKVKSIPPRYDEKPLVKAVTEYNSCFSETQYVAKKQKGRVGLSVFAGAGPSVPVYRGVDIVNNSLVRPGSASFSKTTATNVGLNIDFISGKESSRFVPAVYLGYVKTGRVTAEDHFVTSKCNMWMDFSSIDAMVGLKYKFINRTHWKVYVRGSFGTQVTLKATSKYTITDETFNSTTEPKDFATYKKSGHAYSIATGVSYDRVCLDVKFQQNVAVATVSAQGIVSSVIATIGFIITKP